MLRKSQSAAITCLEPLLNTCICASIKPGTIVFPDRSKTFVFGPISIVVSELLPTTINLPFFTAKLSAFGCLLFTVWILALITTISAI